MKKLIISLAMVLSLVGYVHATPLFDVLDSTFSIDSSVRHRIDDNPDEVKIDHIYRTSYRPIDSEVELQDSGWIQRIKTTTEYGHLHSHVFDENGNSGATARTEVWSESTFRPLVNGSGPEIMFYHTSVYPYGNNEFSIIDNTLGIEIFNPGWDLVPDEERRVVSFNYNNWDMNHTYTLRLALSGSTNAQGNHAYETGSDFYNFAKVPEPSTVAILSLALIGLAGFRKKDNIDDRL